VIARGRRVDHPLDDDGHPHRRVAEPARLPVGDRALAPERVTAPLHRLDQRVGTADVQDRLVLAREAGVRQVLGRGAGPDGDRSAPEPLVGRDDLLPQVVGELAGRGGDAETVGDPLARLDHLGEARGLAADERNTAGIDVIERDQRGGRGDGHGALHSARTRHDADQASRHTGSDCTPDHAQEADLVGEPPAL
jgi:hypothetical protein